MKVNFNTEMKKILYFILISWIPIFSFSQEEIEIYVSYKGAAENPGTIMKPVKNLQQAISLVKKNKNKTHTIYLFEGSYYSPESIEIKNLSNITIRPYQDDEVIITGGMEILKNRTRFVKGTPHEKKFKQEAVPYIRMFDLKELGISDYGKLMPHGFGRHISSPAMELFINQEACQLARWPNDSTVQIKNVIDEGSIPRHRDDSNRGGIFTYQEDHISSWTNEQNIWLKGFFSNGFSENAIQVKNIDAETKRISTIHPCHYGFKSTGIQRYYAYNILQELDTENEYYIDRGNEILFFYTQDRIEKIQASINATSLFVIEDSKNIKIQNLIFENSRSNGIYITGSDNCELYYCTFRNLGAYGIWMGKLFVQHHKKIQDNFFLGKENKNWLTENPFSLDAGKNNSIKYCKIYNTGAGGIYLSGGNRKDLTKGNNIVENCHIHHFARFEKSYRPGIYIQGVGNRISNCHIHHTAQAAILLKGNEHIIEYNDIHDVCLDVNDSGAIYYGRDPSELGNIIRYNYFHHIGNETNNNLDADLIASIYHDDGACGMEVYGNIFHKPGNQAILIGGGNDNHIYNNFFVDCKISIFADDRLMNWGAHLLQKDSTIAKKLNLIHFSSPPYSEQYPNLPNYFTDHVGVPKRNVVEKNIFCNYEYLFGANGKDALEWKEDNIYMSATPHLWTTKQHDRSFIPDPMDMVHPPNWRHIILKKIGIQKDYTKHR